MLADIYTMFVTKMFGKVFLGTRTQSHRDRLCYDLPRPGVAYLPSLYVTSLANLTKSNHGLLLLLFTQAYVSYIKTSTRLLLDTESFVTLIGDPILKQVRREGKGKPTCFALMT